MVVDKSACAAAATTDGPRSGHQPSLQRVHSLQGFIDASFQHISSTDNALSLLAQFQALLQRDTLIQVRCSAGPGFALGRIAPCFHGGVTASTLLSHINPPSFSHTLLHLLHWFGLQELDSKYNVIFAHYARDLEAVQAIYESQKSKPPLPRNAPPIAGAHCTCWGWELEPAELAGAWTATITV